MWKTPYLSYLRAPMTLDRSIAPELRLVEQPEIPAHQEIILDNGLKMYVLHFPDHDILKVEVAFHAGRPEEEQRLAAFMTPKLMQEGAGRYSGGEIAELFEYYGAAMSVWSWLDASGFTLTGLSRYAHETIPLFADVLLQPSFPADELEVLVQTHLQELQVELDKVEVISYRTFTEGLYGAQHPLGYNSTAEDYRALTTDALRQYYEKQFNLANAYIFVTGNIDESVIDLLNATFGRANPGIARSGERHIPPPQSKMPKGKYPRQNIQHPGGLQASIKMGRLLFNRRHPHFYEVQVLNTVFGGYFGSRLMANIREEKGFTYNIYSGIDTYYETGYLYISTEVNAAKTDATLRAIRLEMKKLREEPILEEELSMVRNYMMGALLNGLDGPLNKSSVLRAIIFERIGREGIQRQLQILSTITAERLQELAQMYLKPEDYLTVVVG